MRATKIYFNGRHGKTRLTEKFYAEVTIGDRLVRLPGFTDKRNTEAFGRNVLKLAACRGPFHSTRRIT